MIKKILNKINSISLTKGVFFQDKTYKYDTVFFGAKFLKDLLNEDDIIDLTGNKFNETVKKFVDVFNLNVDSTLNGEQQNDDDEDVAVENAELEGESDAHVAETNTTSDNNALTDSNKNYLRETINFLMYSTIVSEIEPLKFKLLDRELIDFITISIEHAYIFQYLVAFKTYKNDGLWNKYLDYCNETSSLAKKDKLSLLAEDIKTKALSVGNDHTSVWANNYVKFSIMVLGLANSEKRVSRTLVIKDECITPEDLSANKEGTKTENTKDNLYIHDFNLSYVKDYLSEYLVANEKAKSLPVRDSLTASKYHLNTILYGVPGTGKTYSTMEYAIGIIEDKTIEEIKSTYPDRKELMKKYNKYVSNGRIAFTTFHQSFSYEDFIQGLRPVSGDNLKFSSVNGVFKKLADTAIEDKNGRYVMIIDEINRGNISRIFGVLISLLEKDKRWGEINQLSLTLPSGDLFAVPNNLYVIGTMNTADKSISLIDAALRRRFSFIESPVKLELVDDQLLKKVLEILNNELLKKTQNNTDLLIGHAYFMKKGENDLLEIMNDSIIPLLYEYTYDNADDVKAIVESALEGTNFKIDDSSSNYGRIRIKK